MRKIIVFVSAILFLGITLCFAQGEEDSITITTYYPSPYGVYNTLRLFPKAGPGAEAACTNDGEMYYESTDDQVYVCDGSNWEWRTLGGGGAAGFWAASGDDISNTNPGNVGIGTQTPTNLIKVRGLIKFELLNTALGYQALQHTGNYDTAVGYQALYSNTSGYNNTAAGYQALYSNTSGEYNTAMGNSALYGNITGNYNTTLGYQALYKTTGDNNTALGYQALYSNTSGFRNTAVGNNALYSNINGNRNTALGCEANVASSSLTNATAIGYQAVVNDSNKVVIGNASVGIIGGYAIWTKYSDRRLKENIVYKNTPGLSFILKLKPVSFNYKDDVNKRCRDGLIGQDVQEALNELGIEFSGLAIDDDEQKTINTSYEIFVIPLINAVQEQQKQIEELKAEIQRLNKSDLEGA